MEAAIPKYLQCPRTRQARMPENHLPPYPSAVARFKPGIKHVVMAYFGMQQRKSEHPGARKLLEVIATAFDEGLPIGCFANRYMTVVDANGRPLEKTFGMSWWRRLADLQRWAGSHPTHVAIFGAALRYLGALGPAAKLKLYHEVTVATKDQQHFEYLNCHAGTGMLRARTG